MAEKQTILGRISQLAKANINSLLDRAEDPEKMLDVLIEAIEQRTVKGVEKAYLVLKVAQGDLTVRVPADNAEIVGVRDVVGARGTGRLALAPGAGLTLVAWT